MQTNLAYIDDTIDRGISAEVANPKIAEADRKSAKTKAMKSIAGFHLHDQEAENKALDEMIAKRRKQVGTFIEDRSKVREKLSGLGVSPLAVLPTSAWLAICEQAGLIRLRPNNNGLVPVSRDAFKQFIRDVAPQNYRGMFGAPPPPPLYGSDAPPDDAKLLDKAKHDWPGLMRLFFPGGKQDDSSSVMATLVMPTPPADVAATLLKVQSLTLSVAAVAEAIGFKETVTEIRKREIAKRDQEARERWMREDPIVYTDEGTATAIIAQFGDFPIEKEVVDAVVASDKLIADAPSEIDLLTYSTDGTGEMYRHQVMLAMARRQLAMPTWISS
jgi:hypothetical protein